MKDLRSLNNVSLYAFYVLLKRKTKELADNFRRVLHITNYYKGRRKSKFSLNFGISGWWGSNLPNWQKGACQSMPPESPVKVDHVSKTSLLLYYIYLTTWIWER